MTLASAQPSFPLSGSDVPQAAEELHPFHFGKPVPPLLAADYNRRHQQRELRQESEASRSENERRIKHAVLLVSYLSDEATPAFLPLQDIKTWPTLNLAHFPHLRSQLGVTSDEILELYVSGANGKFWIPTLDYSMTVKTDEKIFVRRKGTTTTQHPSTLVDPLALSRSNFSSPSPQTPRKRIRDSDSPPSSSPLAKRSCIDLTTVPPLISPCPVLPALSMVLVPPAPAMSPSSGLDDCSSDQLWALGSVLTPPQLGVKWPQRIYVRDMAQAFAFLEDLADTGDLPDRFGRVFNGMPWKPSTYHLNRRFWDGLPENIKQEARTLPRTRDTGLWTVWRKGKPGWNC